jgi:hypothetical protein
MALNNFGKPRRRNDVRHCTAFNWILHIHGRHNAKANETKMYGFYSDVQPLNRHKLNHPSLFQQTSITLPVNNYWMIIQQHRFKPTDD